MITDSNVTIMVADFDKAVNFYTDILGFTLTYRGGNEWASIKAPGLTIGLHIASKNRPKPGTQGALSLSLAVEDIRSAKTDLEKKGITFNSDIKDDGYVLSAYFGDPDGNPLTLVEVKEHAK